MEKAAGLQTVDVGAGWRFRCATTAVQVQCACLLKWHADWAAASGGLTQTSATWLYALTARLQRPLPQVCICGHAVP